MPPSYLIVDDGWQQTGPDAVGSRKSATHLEAKKDVRLKISILLEYAIIPASLSEMIQIGPQSIMEHACHS